MKAPYQDNLLVCSRIAEDSIKVIDFPHKTHHIFPFPFISAVIKDFFHGSNESASHKV